MRRLILLIAIAISQLQFGVFQNPNSNVVANVTNITAYTCETFMPNITYYQNNEADLVGVWAFVYSWPRSSSKERKKHISYSKFDPYRNSDKLFLENIRKWPHEYQLSSDKIKMFVNISYSDWNSVLVKGNGDGVYDLVSYRPGSMMVWRYKYKFVNGGTAYLAVMACHSGNVYLLYKNLPEPILVSDVAKKVYDRAGDLMQNGWDLQHKCVL